MTKKYTLTVPDDLAEKIDKWKEHFNLSRVFQKAISQAIEEKIGFQQRMEDGEDMDQIIERLKRERYEVEQYYHDKGKDDGLRWAKAAHYKQLKAAISTNYSKVYQAEDGEIWPNPFFNDELKSYFAEVATADDNFRNYTNFPYDWPKEFEQWLHGWSEGVKEFWDAVKVQIGVDQEPPYTPHDDDIPF